MTIADLIATLTELAEEHGDDTEVVIVHQQNYPLRETVYGVAGPVEVDEDEIEAIREANGELSDEEVEAIFRDDHGPAEVALVAGGHPHQGSPYGSRDVWDRAQR